MKRLALFICLASSLSVFSQRPASPSMVEIMVEDSSFEILPATTQTEVKPGWKFVDYKLPDKAIRYLWGRHAQQQTDNARPTFLIRPIDGKLTDYCIVKLKEKKQYRQFAKPNVTDGEYTRIDLESTEITRVDEDRFKIRPLRPLSKGEYVIVNLTSQPINEFGDMQVFPFSVTI